MKSGYKLMLFTVAGLLAGKSFAETVHAAVAANFTTAMKELVTHFEQDSEHKVKLSFGSSGKIFAQIRNGAPFQVFLSADQTKPMALEQAGLTVPHSRFTYAVGALVLWSAKPGWVDSEYSKLKSGDFNKLAFANPKVAPYGVAAMEILQALDLKERTAGKWVQGENIAQTYQFVASGNADLGFVALSQVMDKGHVKRGSSWIVPNQLYSPIRQDAVLLKRGQDSVGAKALLKYLSSDQARAIIHAYGYTTE
ncbi:MAG: molybdate ABC transporter substrate-binding protein [Pseudomonadales bacterium]|nr:molybdate ABC transporter substrate-binding protein [Pseudomonadales bacterium]RLU02795.1 MAG: molybdate ABC transporter substrate-binding protein [Ketobacter sp.]